MEKANLRMANCCETCKYSYFPNIEESCCAGFLERRCMNGVEERVKTTQVCDFYEDSFDNIDIKEERSALLLMMNKFMVDD